MTSLVHIVRHGEALHNVQRGYPDRDPPLTKAGNASTKRINLNVQPDLILISPMTRTIETAMNLFPFLTGAGPWEVPTQIWPDLREANDAICNKGSNIVVITHRGIKAFLVKGKRFGLAETRCYRFATEEETQDDKIRRGVNTDTGEEQDFGPTVLILEESQRKDR